MTAKGAYIGSSPRPKLPPAGLSLSSAGTTLDRMSRRNPPAVPADTDPDVWRRQMAETAKLTPEQRLARWARQQAAYDEIWRAALKRRHPEYTDNDVVMAAVRHFHGDELALAAYPGERLREW